MESTSDQDEEDQHHRNEKLPVNHPVVQQPFTFVLIVEPSVLNGWDDVLLVRNGIR